MTDLTGKIALITGASSGIGEATARHLSNAGVKVALAARRKDKLDALVQEIEASGGSALAIEADVTDMTVCQAAVEQVINKWGKLDILVNNAGVMLIGPVAELPVENWERMIKLNELGLLYMTRSSLNELKKTDGHIVNISSVAGRTTGQGSAVYNMTKWGVNAFTEALRKELVDEKSGVRTTLIEPGAVATELQSHNTPETQDKLKARFGDIKILEADDIAAGIMYAVSQPNHVNVNEILIRPTQQPL
ncbi:SDR family NAD(P)-dependent oxidoreductase [Candidatus Saccharibacteria bacterium]|nr:SDR family NAD(P)-dependent oxidoreductase [Candidatus Saccharibacteria bacterium]